MILCLPYSLHYRVNRVHLPRTGNVGKQSIRTSATAPEIA